MSTRAFRVLQARLRQERLEAMDAVRRDRLKDDSYGRGGWYAGGGQGDLPFETKPVQGL